MNINFAPISMFTTYSLSVDRESIVINGTAHSLQSLVDAQDAGLPLPEFVVGATVDSVDLLLPYWGEASGRALFPEPIIAAPDGVVEFPR